MRPTEFTVETNKIQWYKIGPKYRDKENEST
jgi:hypothetical protein